MKRGDLIERAKKSVDLRTLINLGKQREKGDYVVGSCPFHEDKKPSFLVFADGWRCLSTKCPRPTGSVLDWIAHLEGNDNPTGADIYKIASEVMNEFSSRHEQYIRLPGKSRKRRIKRKRKPLENYSHYFRSITDRHRQYLNGRGFVDSFIDFYGFGSQDDSVAIPVWDGLPLRSKLLTVRYRPLVVSKYGSRYYGIENHNEPYLFNSWVLQWAIKNSVYKIYVFYGELDSLIASQTGIPALSFTNGAKSFNNKWLDAYGGDVIFVPDIGEEEDAISDASVFGIRGSVMTLFNDLDAGKDFNDCYLALKARKETRVLLNNFKRYEALRVLWRGL